MPRPDAVVLSVLAALAPFAARGDESRVDFARDVRPILSRKCFACHGPDEGGRQAKLRLDTTEGATRDRGGYSAIVPGDRDGSELWARITSSIDGDRMPPAESRKSLSADEIELLGAWIDGGARYEQHWAFVAPVEPELSAVRRAGWARNPIDLFVLARLEAEGLQPSAEADRWALASRLALDLTGIPPTYEEARAFVEDARPDAYERLVERLLASPRYGERWARTWLDLARYADSAGYGSDPLRSIWRWRDWVIDAFDANLPYDRFSTLQLAGDLLPDPTTDDLLATAFHRNTMTNTEGGTDDEEFRVAAVKDRAEVTAQAWMGLTLGCAECHSHKYDPISHEEYYRFFAFFDQTEDADRADEEPRIPTPTQDDEERARAIEAQIAELEKELASRAAEMVDERAAWEREEAQAQLEWRSIPPMHADSESGTSVRVRDDDSIEVFGSSASSGRAVTTFFQVEWPEISALRVSASAAGAADEGGFVLSELVVRAQLLDPEPTRGRFLRIELPGRERILSLAEVVVSSGGTDITRRGTASQSSVDYDGRAELAIDGEANGEFERGSVTHTRTEEAPWWELDFGRGMVMDRVEIFTRTDGDLFRRLDGMRVSVLDGKRQIAWTTTVRSAPKWRVALAPGVDPIIVPIRDASASHEQAGSEVARAIDGELEGASGWAIAPRRGVPYVGVFELEPLRPLEARTRLEVDLHPRFGDEVTHTRVHFDVTARRPVPRALPADVERAVVLADTERSADEDAALARLWRDRAPGLADLREKIAKLRAEIASRDVPKTPVMRELPPEKRRQSHVLEKGNFLQKRAAVEPGVPAVLHPWPDGAPLDRAGLAAWLFAAENPLTARVAVNRFWAQLFGVGLVETEEDFGTQGSPPSHPELLDWLALHFRDGGWDVKELLRTIVCSATYRQDSSVDDALLARDPRNRLLARGARFRLEAEMVRDRALAVSGLLSPKMHGPSVFPPQPEGMWQAAFNDQRTWSTSTGEDRWRRALYVFWRRTAPYPSLETFDAPTRETCTLRRIRTNTPLQAFVTLNDPVYVEAAQAFARRIVAEGGASDEERARWALQRATARPARDEDVAPLVALAVKTREHYSGRTEEARALASDPLGPLPENADAVEHAAWTVVANVLLNLDAVLVRS